MQKKTSLYLSLTIATIFFIGGVLISFGFWKVDFFQENLNEAGTSCFRLNFEEKTDAISLLDQEPMYDEDGKKLTPYTFTITNTCDDYASYQVNLENLKLEEKELPSKYIKVELDQNTPNILTNHTSVDPSLENAHSAYKLTSGTLKGKESVTYDLRIWMDENTPAGEETSEASFFSKVTVTTSPTTEENIQNEITSGSESQTPEYNTEKEEVLIHVEGDHGKFNGYYVSDHELSEEEISSISSWKSIVPESNPVDIREVFTESGEYYVYIKDEYGNIKIILIVIDKVDKSGPEIIEVQTTEEWSSKNTITIKTVDRQSGIIGYQFSSIDEEPREYIEVERSQEEKTFTHEVSENGVYYFFVKDNLGHVTRKEVKVTKADAIKPELSYSIASSTEGSNGWYKALSLKVTTIDSLSGVQSAKYCVTTEGVCEPSTNATLNNNEYVVSFSNHSNGQKICSNVTDHAGNISEVKCSEVYKVDNTIPSVTLNGTTNSSVWTKNDSTLTGSVSPSSAPSGYQYQWYQVPEYKHKSNYLFQITEKYESNGSKYYNVTLNKTSGTTDDWANIIFPEYAYTVGHTYRIHFKIRVNSISNMSFEVRHSSVNNDYSGGRKGTSFTQITNGWQEYSVSKVMSTPYVVGSTTHTTLSPRVEIYTGNLALTNGVTSRSVNFDFKDFWVEDLTPDSKSTIANNLAVKLSDTGLSKGFNSSINSWYVLQATTNAGNVASSNKYQVLVDKTVPYASLSWATNTEGSNGWKKAAAIKATLGDAHSGVQSAKYCITTGSTCTPNIAATLSNNSFTATFGSNASAQKLCHQITDKVGNTSSISCDSNSYKVDTVDPTSSFTVSVSGNSIVINASASKDDHSKIASYQYSRDNTNWVSSTSSSYTFTGLNDGAYTVYVRVTDHAGRVHTTSKSVEVAYNNVYVSSGGNDSTGFGSSGKPFATLAKAYGQVKSGGNILLLSNITQSSTATFGTSSKSVNLKSNGSTVYSVTKASNLTTEILRVNNKNTLTTTNITFNGNNVSSTTPVLEVSGGAVLNFNSGSTVRGGNDTNDYSGGGVNISGGTMNLNGGTVTANTTKLQGGGVYVNGGTFTLNSGTISSNTATNGKGGGIFAWGGTVNIKGGNIQGNTGRSDGGGIWIGNGVTLNLSGGTIQSNTGHGIRAVSETDKINISGNPQILSNNGEGIYSSASFTFGSGTIQGNNGDGIYSTGTITVSGGTIYKNKSSGVSGSIVKMTAGNIAENEGSGVSAFSSANISGGTIQKNSGIGIYASNLTLSGTVQVLSNKNGGLDVSGTSNLNGGTISGNTASYGGGVYVTSGTTNINGVKIQNNTATTNGGGVYVSGGATAVINGATISGNTATADGGGIYDYGTTTLKAGTISGNKAVNGAGIASRGSYTFTMTGGTIQNNTATTNGGGLISTSGTMNLSGGTIISNHAESGGGIAAWSSTTVNLSGSIKIQNNTANNQGGGIRLLTDVNNVAPTLTINAGTISGNTAKYGGGLYIYKNTNYLKGGTISGNTASQAGGGFYMHSATLTMTGGSITGNKATNNTGGGIAIYNTGGKATLNGGSITNNTAPTGYVGGVTAWGGGTYTRGGTTISGNSPKDV